VLSGIPLHSTGEFPEDKGRNYFIWLRYRGIAPVENFVTLPNLNSRYFARCITTDKSEYNIFKGIFHIKYIFGKFGGSIWDNKELPYCPSNNW